MRAAFAGLGAQAAVRAIARVAGAYANRRDLAYGSLLTLLPARTLYPEELVIGAEPERLLCQL